jgi:hypothetical protein
VKFLGLVVAGLIFGFPNALFAKDLNQVNSIAVKVSTRDKSVTYGRSGPYTYVGSYQQTIVLERLKVGGETLWNISYFSTGCKIDGRFSVVSALFKAGKNHVETIKCSSVADKESGSIVAQAKASFAKNILSISSTITEDIVREGIRTQAKTTEMLKVDIGKGCLVLAASLVSERRATFQGRNVTSDSLRSTNFNKKCEIYP